MNLKVLYLKQFYHLKQQIEQLTERDRVLLLFLILFGITFLWYLIVFSAQFHFLKETRQKTQDMEMQSQLIKQKKTIIDSLISNPNTATLIENYKVLTSELNRINNELTYYNQSYINSRDLAKLLHDMLKDTLGITIDDFSTVTPSVTITPGREVEAKPIAANKALLQPINYQLVIRGEYFSIMNYLKTLEQLPWRLYWDKFDYKVLTYPEGLATITFYTLKPQSNQKVVSQGINQ